MEDKQFSSHISIRCLRTIPKKDDQARTSRNREKNIFEVSGNILRTLSTGLIQPERKTKDYNSGRHGRMPLLYSSVPSGCIYKAISQRGERVLFERLSTPQRAPKLVFKSSWQTQQQQQQDTSESASARSWKQSARNSVREKRIQTKRQRIRKHPAVGNRTA